MKLCLLILSVVVLVSCTKTNEEIEYGYYKSSLNHKIFYKWSTITSATMGGEAVNKSTLYWSIGDFSNDEVTCKSKVYRSSFECNECFVGNVFSDDLVMASVSTSRNKSGNVEVMIRELNGNENFFTLNISGKYFEELNNSKNSIMISNASSKKMTIILKIEKRVKRFWKIEVLLDKGVVDDIEEIDIHSCKQNSERMKEFCEVDEFEVIQMDEVKKCFG